MLGQPLRVFKLPFLFYRTYTRRSCEPATLPGQDYLTRQGDWSLPSAKPPALQRSDRNTGIQLTRGLGAACFLRFLTGKGRKAHLRFGNRTESLQIHAQNPAGNCTSLALRGLNNS